VGLGRPASRVAELLKPWRVRVIAADPYLESGKFARFGVERTDLDTLLRDPSRDAALQLTAETPNLLDRRLARAHEADACSVNTARGLVVDVEACATRSTRGRSRPRTRCGARGAAPARCQDLEIGRGVLLAPHMIAGKSGRYTGRAIPWAADAALAALPRPVADCVYNTEAVAKWQGVSRGTSLLAEEPNR